MSTTGVRIDDPELAERIRAADAAAIQAVVQAYLPQILRAARGAGLDPDRAEDVTQATFATFIEKASQFEGRSHVRTWLFGILYRKIESSPFLVETLHGSRLVTQPSSSISSTSSPQSSAPA